MLALTEDSPERFDRGEKEEEVKSKISNSLESVSAAEPMGADQEGVKSTTQAGPTQDRKRDLWLASERVIHMQPGRIGCWLDLSTGMIRKVYEGTQAEGLGLEVFDYITKVGSAKFSTAALENAMHGSKDFDVTVEKPSEVVWVVQCCLWCLYRPAGAVGCLLLLGLPYIIYRGLLFGLDLDSKTLLHPAVRLVVCASVAYALGKLGWLLLDWCYSGLGYKIRLASKAAGILGLVMGWLLNLSNPLLNVRLRSDSIKVSEGLPCEPTQFTECVHKPCAELLRDIPANLGPIGLPILLVICDMLPACLRFYNESMLLYASKITRGLPEYWCDVACNAFVLAGCTLAVAVGPLQLSRGLRVFEHQLTNARRLDSNMNLQVEAVEAMLAQVNDGKGWGIPVFEGFVLTKSVMQTLCLRLLLAGTVIKAFLDTELGFHQEEKERSNIQLAAIVDGLRNMTSFFQNQSTSFLTNLENPTS
ncbi:unnamed protein product [Durusdinium trenchii]|uniref:Solute carrier family 40 protein n=1 Tax=Durusdinium trenchii TaxID=1381693 RepID=A0ABP0NB07_9DINO